MKLDILTSVRKISACACDKLFTIHPLLTARCALTGCHVDGGHNTHDIDYTSYEYFIAGGEHGPVFIPGNATESEIIEEMVEGKMPPPESGLPQVPDTEIQVFIDWINQQ